MLSTYLLVGCIVFITSDLAEGQCPRDLRAAEEAGRPRCRRRTCSPSDDICTAGGRVCMCDQECGYSCIDPGITCNPPSDIDNMLEFNVQRKLSNGSLVLVQAINYEYNDVAEYVCLPGYRRAEPIERHFCHRRGAWTGTSVCTLSCQPFSFIGVFENNMRCGDNCITEEDCTGEMSCRCDGFCGRTCVDPNVDCGEAPPSTNAVITYEGEGHDRFAKYSCNEGFFVHSGTPSRKCTGGGTWDGELVVCQQITCGDPGPSIRSTGGDVVGRPSGPFYVSDVLVFTCPPSHRLVGSGERRCSKDGQWNGKPAVCVERGQTSQCPHPGIPINGNILSSLELQVGSFVEFSCNPEYLMVGEKRQECLYFLQWSDGGAPRCIDTRYPSNDLETLGSFQEDVMFVQSVSTSGIGRSLEGGASNYFEVYFVIDVSNDVTDGVLRDSLSFAEDRVKAMSISGRIRCEIIVLASDSLVHLKMAQNHQEIVIEHLQRIREDRYNILRKIGFQRNTHQAITRLRQSLLMSFNANDERTRFVFLCINGMHDEGEPPYLVMNEIRSQHPEDLLKVYLVAFGTQIRRRATKAELMAISPNAQFFETYNLRNLALPDIQTASEDFEDCGKAGDVGNIRRRTAIGRVIAGSFASERAWPWQVLLTTQRESVFLTYNTSVFGGGSLINNQWVLSAAHVFSGIKNSPRFPGNVLLTMGLHRLPRRAPAILPPTAQVFAAEEIIIHDGFTVKAFDYDIALIKVGQKLRAVRDRWFNDEERGVVNFTANVRRVCLPCMPGNCVGSFLEREGILNGRESKRDRCNKEETWLYQEDEREEKNVLAAVTGFGSEIPQLIEATNLLKQGLIRLRSDERCQADRDRLVNVEGLRTSVEYTENMMCGIGNNRSAIVDACQGDSGGPLVREVITDEDDTCWVQLGITSWGLGCALSYREDGSVIHYPGFYTKVTSLIDWISSHTEGDLECIRDESQLEEGRTCGRPCQVETGCPARRRRCVCDDACGMTCFNPELRCRVEAFENGVITGDQTYGETITHTCNEGYRLVGQATRRCRSDRKWTGRAPTCKEITCPARPTPPNVEASVTKPVWKANDVVRFSCVGNRRLVGESTSTCQLSGDWSSPVPTCKDILCDPREPPLSAVADNEQDQWMPGDTVTYTCEVGFELAGEATAECLNTGEWSHDLPECNQITCPVRPTPPNVEAIVTKPVWKANDAVRFSCVGNRRLVGESTSTCQLSGDWSSPVPTCKEITCPVRPTPPNVEASVTKPVWKANDAVRFSCVGNRRLVGESTSTCQLSGDWSSPVPTCRRVLGTTCPHRNPPDDSIASPDKTVWMVGDIVTYICRGDFALEGEASSTCHEGGTWSTSLPRCVDYSKCGQAGDVGNVKHQARVKRVIGGENTNAVAWPWQVAITRFEEMVFRSYSTDNFFGGGSVINNQWVLTASLLFSHVDRSPGWERGYLLTFGIRRLPNSRSDVLPPTVKVFVAERIFEHPKYDVASLYDFNVALIKIGQEFMQSGFRFVPAPGYGWVNYTASIRPVCLPCSQSSCARSYLRNQGFFQRTETEEEKCNTESDFLLGMRRENRVLGVFTGFGHVEPRAVSDHAQIRRSDTLRQGLLRIRDDAHCGEITSRYIPWSFPGGIPYTDTMLCATTGIAGQNIDSCNGDSGGPLVREVAYSSSEEEESCWVQVGISSWGWGCGQHIRVQGLDLPVPGYYTNVIKVSSWIRTTMEENAGRTCRHRVPPESSTASPDNEFWVSGDIATYACSGSLTLEGEAISICQEDGTWSTALPRCVDYSTCGEAGADGSLGRQWNGVEYGPRPARRRWPWQVAISSFNEIVFRAYTPDSFYGGGSLINNRWVLTAAHLFSAISRFPGWQGSFLLTFGINVLPQTRHDMLPDTVKVYTADKIIEHPEFDRHSPFDFDIALVNIGQEFKQEGIRFVRTDRSGWLGYTEHIRPACLPCMEDSCVGEYLRREGSIQGDESEERKCEIETKFLSRTASDSRLLAIVTGFGDVEERQFLSSRQPTPSQALQEKLLRLRDDYYCGNFSSRHIPWQLGFETPFTNRMLCATSGIPGENIDSCQGDAGGPMVREVSYVTEEERKSCWVQIGIVSWGWGCRQFLMVNGRNLQVPGYYTNVALLSSWIKQELAKPENNAPARSS